MTAEGEGGSTTCVLCGNNFKKKKKNCTIIQVYANLGGMVTSIASSISSIVASSSSAYAIGELQKRKFAYSLQHSINRFLYVNTLWYNDMGNKLIRSVTYPWGEGQLSPANNPLFFNFYLKIITHYSCFFPAIWFGCGPTAPSSSQKWLP